MPAHVVLQCTHCGHTTTVNNNWAREHLPTDQYTSVDSILFYLQNNLKKLRCQNCGMREPSVSLGTAQSPAQRPPELPESEKRFIDEGLAGSREDHKKMRARARPTGKD